jgi:hypothetical protein
MPQLVPRLGVQAEDTFLRSGDRRGWTTPAVVGCIVSVFIHGEQSAANDGDGRKPAADRFPPDHSRPLRGPGPAQVGLQRQAIPVGTAPLGPITYQEIGTTVRRLDLLQFLQPFGIAAATLQIEFGVCEHPTDEQQKDGTGYDPYARHSSFIGV